ncbi:hypothetical protein FOZ60_017162, partial [Perkinsus olseni]
QMRLREVVDAPVVGVSLVPLVVGALEMGNSIDGLGSVERLLTPQRRMLVGLALKRFGALLELAFVNGLQLESYLSASTDAEDFKEFSQRFSTMLVVTPALVDSTTPGMDIGLEYNGN